MQHVPEGVIQAPESPDAPEALPGCREPLRFSWRVFCLSDQAATSRSFSEA